MLKSNRTQEKAKSEARKKALNSERTPRNCRGTVEELSSQQVTNRWSGDEAMKKDTFDFNFSIDDIELDFDLDSLLDDCEIDLSLDEIDFDFDFEIPSEIELNSERTVRKRKSNKERTKRKSKS